MIYTGSFSNISKYENDNLFIISIDRKTPKDYTGFIELIGIPTESLLNDYNSKKINNTDCSKKYIEELNKIKKQLRVWLDNIVKMVGKSNIIFISNNNTKDFSYEPIFFEYLNKHFNANIKEYT